MKNIIETLECQLCAQLQVTATEFTGYHISSRQLDSGSIVYRQAHRKTHRLITSAADWQNAIQNISSRQRCRHADTDTGTDMQTQIQIADRG